jgi:hypothetical protein
VTDNQKAATFIGWTGDLCKNSDWRWETADRETGRCADCAFTFSIDQDYPPKFLPGHIAPAPDMSDPRNYMKALEALDEQFAWDVFRRAGKIAVMIWRADRSTEDVINNRFVWECTTPAAALVVLYDAEHPAAHDSIAHPRRETK